LDLARVTTRVIRAFFFLADLICCAANTLYCDRLATTTKSCRLGLIVAGFACYLFHMHRLCTKFPWSRRGYGAASSLLDLAGLLARPFFAVIRLSQIKSRSGHSG
jgi:hypothetical protein